MAAIKVRNAHKSYGNGAQPILNGLSLTVSYGTIYGLLGSSGCGKTTLLSCIIGVKELDSGKVSVLGGSSEVFEKSPSLLGYMPQDTALTNDFTVKEVLSYYGLIYGMGSREIRERIHLLSSLLDITFINKRIRELSGGQLRRASFAVALIHKPQLIILDEPTVGLDPVLRERIWSHLRDLVSQKSVTVVITTHYIEEARYCNKVGVLRQGRLLAEESPLSLLTRFETISLESAVLQLCREDEWTNNNKNSSPSADSPDVLISSDGFEDVYLTKMNRRDSTASAITLYGENSLSKPAPVRSKRNIMQALLKKQLTLQCRSVGFVLAQLIIPVIQVFIFANTFGLEPLNLRMLMVSHDLGAKDVIHLCNQFDSFQRNNNNKTCLFGKEQNLPMICSLVKHLESETVYWDSSLSRETAISQIAKGKALGYMEIPANFSFHLQQRLLLRNFVDEGALVGSTLKLRMDETVSITSSSVKGKIYEGYQRFLNSMVSSCGLDERLVQLPIEFKSAFGGKSVKSWSVSVQPAIVILGMFGLAGLPVVNLVMEKRQGTMDRENVAGVTYIFIALSNIISAAWVTLLQILSFYGTLVLFYEMNVQGPWVALVGLTYLVALSGLTFALLLGSVLRQELFLVLALLTVTGVHLISTGSGWPIAAVTSWYRPFCQLLPITFPIEAAIGIILKGWGVQNLLVLRGFGVSILYTLMCLVGSFVIFRRK